MINRCCVNMQASCMSSVVSSLSHSPHLHACVITFAASQSEQCLAWAAADAATVLADPCLGLSSTYPWPYMFATVATLLIFVIEFLLKKYYNWRTARIAAAAMEQQAGNNKQVEAADAEAVSI